VGAIARGDVARMADASKFFGKVAKPTQCGASSAAAAAADWSCFPASAVDVIEAQCDRGATGEAMRGDAGAGQVGNSYSNGFPWPHPGLLGQVGNSSGLVRPHAECGLGEMKSASESGLQRGREDVVMPGAAGEREERAGQHQAHLQHVRQDQLLQPSLLQARGRLQQQLRLEARGRQQQTPASVHGRKRDMEKMEVEVSLRRQEHGSSLVERAHKRSMLEGDSAALDREKCVLSQPHCQQGSVSRYV